MKSKLALITLVTGLLFTGCSDDESPYSCASCIDSPEALAANDDSGMGIYKGVVVGSSGTIKFNIANNSSTISAILIIDGEEIELTTEATFGEGGFEGYFYGTMNSEDDVVVGFYVNSTGTSWEIFGVEIPGHDDPFIGVTKEFSDQLVEVFEGTFSGDDSGTFNLIVLRDGDGDGEWVAVARSDGDTFFEGEIEGNELFGGGGEIIVAGEIAGDNVSGAWEHTQGGTGSWKGRRTL